MALIKKVTCGINKPTMLSIKLELHHRIIIEKKPYLSNNNEKRDQIERSLTSAFLYSGACARML